MVYFKSVSSSKLAASNCPWNKNKNSALKWLYWNGLMSPDRKDSTVMNFQCWHETHTQGLLCVWEREAGNMTAFTANITLTLSSRYQVTHTERGLEVLIFVCEGGVNNSSHMTRIHAARSQRCVYMAEWLPGIHWLTDWLSHWVADGVTGLFTDWFTGSFLNCKMCL